MSDLRDGLVAMSNFAEAALESNIRNAAEIRKLTVAVHTLAEHAESNGSEFGAMKKELQQLRMGVFDLKVEADDLRKKVQLLPAMKEMLGDILARLPE